MVSHAFVFLSAIAASLATLLAALVRPLAVQNDVQSAPFNAAGAKASTTRHGTEPSAFTLSGLGRQLPLSDVLMRSMSVETAGL